MSSSSQSLTSAESSEAYRAANHFGLGACAADLQAARADPRGWLQAQLEPLSPGPPAPPSRQVLNESLAARSARRQAQQGADGDPERIAALEAEQKRFRRQARGQLSEQTIAQFEHLAGTAAPYQERLVRFWFNHFTVSVQGRPQLIGACLPFENEVIRPGLGGHFADLLLNVTAHPVMLSYLDNAQSIGPDSRAGRRSGRGLNENLAREILELHTLGVDGGYQQDDIRALAAMLTGWTVGNERLRRLGAEPGAFAFVPVMHQPGAQTFLGRRYPEGGQEQALQALRDLASHPATAGFVAGKLVRHFVADQPPAGVVEQISRVFQETDGHLPSLHRALTELPQAWSTAERKLKTPYELVLSAHRGLALPVQRPGQVLGPLRTMNHVPFTAPSPAGWPDERAHWSAPSALIQRLEWGVAYASRAANQVDVRAVTDLLVAAESSELAGSLSRAESPAQALGLLLASPDFQWR